MVEVIGLEKKFGHFTAVDKISFKVSKGEFSAFSEKRGRQDNHAEDALDHAEAYIGQCSPHGL
jgi:ABC-type uncharacterized transport system ATPase subunit